VVVVMDVVVVVVEVEVDSVDDVVVEEGCG
jgi:hypothetical protein